MKAILFDLDGTLHDSEKWYIKACCDCLEKARGKSLTDDEKNYLIGKPIMVILNEWFEGREQEVLELFFKCYEGIQSNIEPYKDVHQMLNILKRYGIRMGIVTSKYKKYVYEEMKSTNLDVFFDVVVTLDDCDYHKPHPAPINMALERLGVQPYDCIYIGDQPTDIQAAHRAGIKSGAALWGEGIFDQLITQKPSYIFEEPQDILDAFLKVEAGRHE